MSYSAEVLADTPRVYWRLDEASGNFADASGNGYTAVASGTAYTYQQAAAVGEGYSISNNSDARAGVDLPDWTDPNVWTVEAWIKTSNDGSGPADGMGVFDQGVGGVCVRIGPSPAGVIYLVKSSNANDGISTVTVSDNQWHHVVVRRTGGVSSIWIDGVDRSGTMANPSYINNTNTSGFGAQWLASPASPKTSTYFLGNLDDIAVYDSALSDARIIAHFNAASAVQTLLVSTDSVDGAWTDQAGGTSLAAAIDETTFSDSDYIRSEVAPSNSGCRVKLASGGDPASSSGHQIMWRAGKQGTRTVDMTVKLRQGGGNSLGGGTLIASFNRSGVGALTSYTETLSGGEADAITDYADLYLEFCDSDIGIGGMGDSMGNEYGGSAYGDGPYIGGGK